MRVTKDVSKKNIDGIGADKSFLELSNYWNEKAIEHHYAYNFSWLGRPIMQVPQDIYAVQEIIWRVKPDLVVETGIAHGGSLILSASMLALLDYCEGVERRTRLDPESSNRCVIGIDIDIRSHNRTAIEDHPLSRYVEVYQGSSTSNEIIEKVITRAEKFQRCLVFLDSHHTHDHVLGELEAYAPLVSTGSYCVVWDTGLEDLPDGFTTDRPWGRGNNPKTAVREYLQILANEGRTGTDGNRLEFETDKRIEHKLSITASPDGFLYRV